MAHCCPECGSYCTCNGDWDDAELSHPVDVANCVCCVSLDDIDWDEEEVDDETD